MAIADLTQEQLQSVLAYDPETGNFLWKTSNFLRNAGDIAGYITARGYRKMRVGKHVYYAHRLAWLNEYGKWPDGEIDHINHNKQDNRIQNLRSTDKKGNARNRRCRNRTGYSGLRYSKATGCWKFYAAFPDGSRWNCIYQYKADAIARRRQILRQQGFHKNHGIRQLRP
jgi:uncharacterized protein YeaC (DUF1315 family)